MKKTLFTLLLLVATILTPQICAGKTIADNTKQDSLVSLLPTLQGKQKLEAYESLYRLAKFTLAPNEMLAYVHQFIKEARRQNNIPKEAYARFAEIEACYNNGMTEQLNEVLPEHLQFMYDNAEWYLYFSSYNLKIARILHQEDTNLALEEARKMYDIATQVKYDQGIAAALISMAKGYDLIDQTSKAIEALEEALKILKHSPRSAFKYSAYWYLSRQYAYANENAKLIDLIKQWEGELNQMIAEGDDPREHAEKFNEIYQGYAKAYARSGNPEKALEYVELARPYTEMLGRGTHRQLWNLELNILYTQNRYDELLPIADRIYTSAIEDGQVYTAIQMLRRKARVYALLGNAMQTENYYELYLEKKDSVANLNLESQLHEMQSQYEVDKHKMEKEQARSYLVFATIGCLLLLLLLVGWILYSRTIRLKNVGLMERIREQDFLAKKVQQLEGEVQAREPADRHTELLDDDSENNSDSDDNSKDKYDLLYENLTRCMHNIDLFLDPSFSRKSLTDLLGTNEKYLSKVIKDHYATTITEFINEVRLSHAKKLLADSVNRHTIETIAIEAGFGSRTTFHRLFRKRYALSPDEYRKYLHRHHSNSVHF